MSKKRIETFTEIIWGGVMKGGSSSRTNAQQGLLQKKDETKGRWPRKGIVL